MNSFENLHGNCRALLFYEHGLVQLKCNPAMWRYARRTSTKHRNHIRCVACPYGWCWQVFCDCGIRVLLAKSTKLKDGAKNSRFRNFAEVYHLHALPDRRPVEGGRGPGVNHCSKFVVVIGSNWFKTSINESAPPCCKLLKNIVKSQIFNSNQNGPEY